MRPIAGRFEPGFGREFTDEQRRDLLLWWDSWVTPHLEQVLRGDSSGLRYLGSDVAIYEKIKKAVEIADQEA